MRRPRALVLGLLVVCGAMAVPGAAPSGSGAPDLAAAIGSIYPDLDALYRDLHANPELSLQEERTAAKLAGRLKALGYETTTGVGGHGIVGVLKNGTGPTILLRTDLDALPVEERTDLPFASHVTSIDAEGRSVPVMHACGHDVHMTAWVGAAALMARLKDRWRGTLVLVGQPAEEVAMGSRAMIRDGLFARFPRPDDAIAIHVDDNLPAGTVGATPGYALANTDSVDVTIFGRGGHGAYPQATVDPIVIAARFVVAIQTIVSREKNPFDPAVVTVGSIHGGTKHNIIPDEVRLQLTVRTYKDEVRRQVLAAIERIAKAEAEAAAAPRAPEVKVTEGVNATYNDPALMDRVARAVRASLGEDRVREVPPSMAGEDFSEIGRAGIPSAILWVGAVDPAVYEASLSGGRVLPALHSSAFVPDRERTIRTAVLAEVSALLDLLGRP